MEHDAGGDPVISDAVSVSLNPLRPKEIQKNEDISAKYSHLQFESITSPPFLFHTPGVQRNVQPRAFSSSILSAARISHTAKKEVKYEGCPT